MSDLIGIIGGSLTAFTAFAASVGFAYKGWIDWMHDPDPIKSKKGMYYFWGGVFGFAATVIFVIIVIACWTNNQSPPLSSTPTPALSVSASPSDTTNDPTMIKNYVDNYHYNGAIYSGYIDSKTKHPDGKGKMTFMNQNVYDGEWVDGVQQGNGLMQYNNGDKYDGKWQNGKRNGDGVYTWKDGRQYRGAYKDDKRDGEGVFTGWIDSTVGWKGTYYGNSKDDKFDVYGKFLFDSGDKFEGIFKDNKFWDGTYTRKDRSQYEIKNGEPI